MVGPVFIQFRVGEIICEMMMEAGLGKLAIFGVLTLILFILGCIGEMFPIIIILIPTVFPTLYGMGLHPWWLVIYLVLMGGIGGLTPPLGGMLFVVAGMAKVEPYYMFRKIIPWVICFFVVVIILYLCPGLVTWLPGVTGFSPPIGF